jgi:SHS2 domain-containing protein
MHFRSESESDESRPSTGFEEVEHTADWALRVYGQDLEELLVNAARGMGHLLVSQPIEPPFDLEEHIELEAYDAEGLLVNWLSELAYWAEVEGVIFAEFKLHQVTPTYLQATIRGVQASDLQKHIKAVTYHNLEIVETPAGLVTTVIFDV